MAKIILNTDGGSRGNPGPAGAGAVITSEAGEVLKTASKFLGQTTNNEAEYQGVLLGLDLVKKYLGKDKVKTTEVEVRVDSELIARQLSGVYMIKEERLWPYFMAVWNLRVSEFKKLSFTEIPRAENKIADGLANEAMDSGETNNLF